MNADDPRHGTTRGFHAGCREQCCRWAISRYQKQIRLNQRRGTRLSVPAVGAQRRIQALMTLGWTSEDIATEAGYTHRNQVLRILNGQKGKPCTWLERKTHETIAELFERMAMQVPPMDRYRRRARTMAERRGWLPPLAWDDIDDPAEQPRLGREKGRKPLAEFVEDCEWLADAAESVTTVAERLCVTNETVRDRLRIAGRMDIY